MLHLFKSAAASAITFGLIGLLAVGLLIGAVRLVLPFADLFRAELEAVLSDTLGLEVRVGHLGLHLAGLDPRIVLQDAELLDPSSGHHRLSLEQLRVGLNLTASLRELAPQLESVTLVGARLIVKRLEDGTVVVAGLEAMEAENPEAMSFFLGNGSFGLADSDLYWIDEQSGAPALHLSDVRAHFENRGESHRIGVLARLHGDPQTRVRLVGDMRGEPGNPADWSGEIYVHLRGGGLDRILDGRLPEGLRPGSDLVELESWNLVQGTVVTESLNLVAAKGLSFTSKSGEEARLPVQLDELGGLVRWRLTESGWRLEIKDLALTLGGARRPDSDLEIRFAAGDDGGWAIAGGNDFLDLTVARNLLARLPRLLPEEFASLGEIRPGGVLHDLRFRFAHRPELPPLWAASGRIEDLSLDAHGQFPGIAGFTAELAADERAGQLVLSSGDLALDLPRLLPDPIRLDEATGEIRWRRDAVGALRVEAREIVAGNADILTRSRFSIAIPADGAAGGGSPFLDLYTEFKDAEVASVRDYVPSKKLKKKLAGWLGRAFVGGTIPSGALLFRGALADFPFDEQQGRFEVLFGVQDTTLDFHPDWPRLEGLVGEVRFENREMEIFVFEGRFLDSELENVSARIPDLENAVAVEIRGRVEGPFADGLRVLGETPLRKKLGAVARALETEGVSRLDLDMAIPLPLKGRKGQLRLAGELTWPGPAALAVADRGIRLTDLAGTLHFTERTLEAEAIEARLWDVPVRMRVDTREPRGKAGRSTRIQVAGRFPSTVLAQRFPSPAWEPVKGRARLELRIDIGTADMSESMPPIDFELTSDLAGLALDLPAPVGKPTAATRRLHLSGRLASEGALRIQGGYGDLGIDLALDRRSGDAPRLARGSFNLGGGPIPLPKGEGLTLGGSVATLDLPAWIEWGANRGPTTVGSPGESATLRSVTLHAQRMLLSGVVLNDVRLDLDRRGDRWDAKIEATELEGTVAIPHRPHREPLRITLARLDLKGLFGQEGEEHQAPAVRGHTDPRQVHTLDLSIERLLWGETPLGQVTLRSQAAADGLDFTELVLAGPSMSVQGQGSWKQTDAGPRSHLSLTANWSDLGEFLRGIELESPIQGAPAELALDLDWPGGPGQFSAAELEGRIRFDVEAGSLLEIEPGVGRVLGILNLDALQRRLTLDFSDLFGRGYAFEKISGQLEIQQGTATIEELVIEGPSADIVIAGSTNLVDRQFNQMVTVTPRIGTGVAIASAVAGGPLVGAAVFLADRVSGGAVDKLGRHQYVLTGPWAAPEIHRVGRDADTEQEAAQGQFMEDWGRAGASGTRETKPVKARTDAAAAPESAEAVGTPSSSQGGSDENLFLEGF